jgi:prephenate dehydrogenase
MPRILIIGTGLIGASIGLALKAAGFDGEILGFDTDPAELDTARRRGALDIALGWPEAVTAPDTADIYVLATPVLPILDWMHHLAPVLGEHQLITDVGSTKGAIASLAQRLFNRPGHARFLPGHPMAGKETGGAALADAALFQGTPWLFTPVAPPNGREVDWRSAVERMGALSRDMDPVAHDEVCAWVSHLPQMVSTALAALLEDTFADDPEKLAAVQAIGGRALRETTRLGASPYSMWRDVAVTNTDPIAASLHALEQRLAHIRENLRTPQLRDEFTTANRFRPKP